MNPQCGLQLWQQFDHVILNNMIDAQIQMKTPLEEREQQQNNEDFYNLFDPEQSIDFGTRVISYTELVQECLNYQPLSSSTNKKISEEELSVIINAGGQLSPEQLKQLVG